MKAARIVPGPQGGRLEIQDVPRPQAGPGQVLVRVMAAGLNRGEIKMVREATQGAPKATGVEFAGLVAAVGAGVTNVQEGDHVAGHGIGGQAEYVVAQAGALIKVPRDSLSWVELAAYPNVFITAHDALVVNGELRRGETVLVNAASSGIGLAAIQLAAQLGASQVLATSRSAAKVARLKEYGATRAIDTSREDQVAAVMEATGGKGVDIIIDTVGGTVFDANLKSLAIKGRLVNIGRMGSSSAQFDLTQMWLKRLKLIGVTFRTRSEEERVECIQACARDTVPLLEAGRLRFPVDRAFPLDQLEQAHAHMATDQHFGKIVIAVDPSVAAGAAA